MYAGSSEFCPGQDGHVSLKVFDLLGRGVAALIDAPVQAGVGHKATFRSLCVSVGDLLCET